ncbi:uncharacterized protein M421DRAFT_93592 [Didymella exigua CBS 183.55]|uniref:Uncharacterized protein n=1 Tax=Didymella exigua CBS 183.55 TaxID=1150837 RepID=A0A6A5RGZ7_9PLEO|nr:uncharacterized protein M421DRAFT_93592 [Didymella exigua CBS 183.55]KAF1927022.1 hypothetical protein M421DRAFT_93592 [Didymella exigua CBS 183.55]
MTAIARNNAFGAGSPSWNLSFPDGNLTAAEILAYLPHWLKSVDVILRLVNHGGRSVTITHLLNKYRKMPTGGFQPNSTTVMMQYAMRRARNEAWAIGTRGNFNNDRDYDENSVYVGDFRPPRLTHPKSASTKQKAKKELLARNCAANPIPFKDLALHVKEHPSGDDALDLTRCVRYALKHPKEKWLFPTDFVELVQHIGGPLIVTHSHFDRQLFGRYDHLYGQHDPSRPPANWNRTRGKRKQNTDETETKTNRASNDELGIASESDIEIEGKNNGKKAITSNPKPRRRVVRRAQGSAMAATTQVDGSHDDGGMRRSGRRVKKAPVYTDKDGDATDIESFEADYTTPHKKRRVARILRTPKDEESDFEAKEELESEDEILPALDEADKEDFGTPTAARGKRLASRKARQTIQEQSPAVIMEQFRTAHTAAKPTHRTFIDHDPDMMVAARAWETRKPMFVPPPLLSEDRLVIDAFTLCLYAQEGCRNEDEMWASALSFYRFGGPRRHAPFRELYRLTEPYVWDTSDWAENVRWAKEQYKHFGVKTWTEYDYHLEYIQQVRMQTLWVSEEVVHMGMW